MLLILMGMLMMILYKFLSSLLVVCTTCLWLQETRTSTSKKGTKPDDKLKSKIVSSEIHVQFSPPHNLLSVLISTQLETTIGQGKTRGDGSKPWEKPF